MTMHGLLLLGTNASSILSTWLPAVSAAFRALSVLISRLYWVVQPSQSSNSLIATSLRSFLSYARHTVADDPCPSAPRLS